MPDHPDVLKVLRLGSNAKKGKLLVEYEAGDGKIYTKHIHVKRSRCMVSGRFHRLSLRRE